MAADREMNVQMDEVLTRVGWSRKELARRVNQRARARGVRLHTDATRVRHWLAGQQPQSPVPELLSELFSEQLGYPIIPVDLGLGGTDEQALGLRYSESIAATVVAVAALGRYDMRRDGFLRYGTFLAVAAVAPSRDWLLAVLDATERRSGSRIGTEQVDLIREAFAGFLEADATGSGGHARSALTEYLTSRVLPLLQDADPHSEAGAALFAAAAEQTALLGWMASDDDRQSLAQRYHTQALRLAQESGDAALGANILADMSEQALVLGYPREALIPGRRCSWRRPDATAWLGHPVRRLPHGCGHCRPAPTPYSGTPRQPCRLWSNPNAPSNASIQPPNRDGPGSTTRSTCRAGGQAPSPTSAAQQRPQGSPAGRSPRRLIRTGSGPKR